MSAPTREERGSAETVLLTGDRWVLARVRRRDRVLAGWRQLTLDAQLAAGLPAATDRLRAVRAGMLVRPALRRELAGSWEQMLGRTARPGRIPVQRRRILDAQDDIRLLIAALRVAQPVPARGVAIANQLLTDGSGPVYNAWCADDLRGLVRDAVHYLDPTSAFPASLVD